LVTMAINGRFRPEELRGRLLSLLNTGQLVRAMEVHSGISALVASRTRVQCNENGKNELLEFDALWESGLTDSASKGFPDIEILGFESRLHTIEEIVNVANKPIIVDGDTGRDVDFFTYFLIKLERLGVSAIIVEDKTFPKRNSLDPDAIQNLEDPDIFANKIKVGKAALLSNDFLIFARLESLIAGRPVEDALFRARRYLSAGADGIMIHSRERDPANIFRFATEYDKLCKELGFRKPLICVPTTYNTVREEELKRCGFNIMIYANQLLRASVKSMQEVCRAILLNRRGFEAEPHCVSVSEIFDMVGFTQIREREMKSSLEKSRATQQIK